MEKPHANRSARHPSVSDLLGIALALDDDELRDSSVLRTRDREVGMACQADRVRDSASQLVVWLEAREDFATSTARKLRDALRGLVGLLSLAGFLLGWATAVGLLAFESGRGRINVVLVLALLVAAPVGLLLLSMLAGLPTRGARRIPGAELLVGGLRWLSTGRLAMRLLPSAQRDALATLWGRGVGQARLYGATRKWLLLTISQSAALAFGAGALIGTVGLVVFTDLAFGWSTTLEVASASFHRGIWWVARPWSAVWTDAVPPLELVEATRFFRVAPVVPGSIDPSVYGRWWPFVVAAVAVYAVVPRVLWSVFCAWRLRRSVRVALLQMPGAREVLDRMQSPLIEMAQVSATRVARADEPSVVDWSSERRLPGSIICWSQSVDPTFMARVFGPDAPAPLAGGGSRSLAEDRAAIARASDAAGDVAIVVRGYEPPLAELLDFVRDLRASIGEGRRIDVLPVGASEDDLRIWSGALARCGDPWLRAVSLSEKAS